jgi:hypothetical protein
LKAKAEVTTRLRRVELRQPFSSGSAPIDELRNEGMHERARDRVRRMENIWQTNTSPDFLIAGRQGSAAVVRWMEDSCSQDSVDRKYNIQ